ASQYLDAKITFVTERQILKGWLSRYKLLLVPAVRNTPTEVFEKIWDYAVHGGRVLVVPESFLGDEYNRATDHASRLGLIIRQTQRPKPGGVGAMVQGYDQSLSQSVAFVDDTPQKLSPTRTEVFGSIDQLETRGIRQIFEAKSDAKILFRYSDGGPAIVQMAVGQGAIYYSGSSLEERSYGRLLEDLFREARVTRPVRLRIIGGGDAWNIEARFAPLGNRKLLYLVNYNSTPKRVRVDAGPGFFSSLLDLRDHHDVQGAEITLPAHQTAIYEMF
ncbi:MAG: hypothetical protein DMG49_16740, partial [Acidobacteria bacterium]